MTQEIGKEVVEKRSYTLNMFLFDLLRLKRLRTFIAMKTLIVMGTLIIKKTLIVMGTLIIKKTLVVTRTLIIMRLLLSALAINNAMDEKIR